MEEKQVIYKIKKSPGKTVAIIILSLLLVISISYILYNEYIKLISSNEESKVTVREEMYYSEVSDILEQIDLYNEVFKSAYPINNVNDLDNQLKLKFGVYALKKTENINNYYKIEDMKEIYKNYFIDSFKVIYENIECPNKDKDLYELNSDTKTFIEVDGHEHGIASMDTDTYFVSGKISGNKYIIDTNILYSNYCNGTCNPEGGYYMSYDDAVKGNDPVTYKRSEYIEISDELPVTTFTFIKYKSHYKLESVKINK